MQENDVKGKVIRNWAITNRLLDCGHRIIHVKPDKDDPDKKKSVFVFHDTEEFQTDLARIMAEHKKTYTEDEVNKKVEEEVNRRIQEEVASRVDAAIEERLKKIEKFAEV